MTYRQMKARRGSDAQIESRIQAGEERLRLARQQLDAAIDRDLAARTPERIAQDNAELSRLDVVASDESIRREERLAQRRSANTDTFGT
jgi:hypothetical protein